jgi:hypothetical protein
MRSGNPALVGALLVVALLALGLLVRAGPTGIDTDVAAWVTGWSPAALTDLFDTLATLPVVALLAAAGVVASLLLRQPGAAAGFLVGLASELPTALVKAVGRSRVIPAATPSVRSSSSGCS